MTTEDDDILALIDGALRDYTTSTDAMRWAPESEKNATPTVSFNGEDITGYLAGPITFAEPEREGCGRVAPWDGPRVVSVSFNLREAFLPLGEAMTKFMRTLARDINRKLNPPRRGRPRPLTADGRAYRRRSLARRRRNR